MPKLKKEPSGIPPLRKIEPASNVELVAMMRTSPNRINNLAAAPAPTTEGNMRFELYDEEPSVGAAKPPAAAGAKKSAKTPKAAPSEAAKKPVESAKAPKTAQKPKAAKARSKPVGGKKAAPKKPVEVEPPRAARVDDLAAAASMQAAAEVNGHLASAKAPVKVVDKVPEGAKPIKPPPEEPAKPPMPNAKPVELPETVPPATSKPTLEPEVLLDPGYQAAHGKVASIEAALAVLDESLDALDAAVRQAESGCSAANEELRAAEARARQAEAQAVAAQANANALPSDGENWEEIEAMAKMAASEVVVKSARATKAKRNAEALEMALMALRTQIEAANDENMRLRRELLAAKHEREMAVASARLKALGAKTKLPPKPVAPPAAASKPTESAPAPAASTPPRPITQEIEAGQIQEEAPADEADAGTAPATKASAPEPREPVASTGSPPSAQKAFADEVAEAVQRARLIRTANNELEALMGVSPGTPRAPGSAAATAAGTAATATGATTVKAAKAATATTGAPTAKPAVPKKTDGWFARTTKQVGLRIWRATRWTGKKLWAGLLSIWAFVKPNWKLLIFGLIMALVGVGVVKRYSVKPPPPNFGEELGSLVGPSSKPPVLKVAGMDQIPLSSFGDEAEPALLATGLEQQRLGCLRQVESSDGTNIGTYHCLEVLDYQIKIAQGDAKKLAEQQKADFLVLAPKLMEFQKVAKVENLLCSQAGALGDFQVKPSSAMFALKLNANVDKNGDKIPNPGDPEESFPMAQVLTRHCAKVVGERFPSGIEGLPGGAVGAVFACYHRGASAAPQEYIQAAGYVRSISQCLGYAS
ncbi:MAG: hypothetical protein V1821_01815 [bacterium]